MICLVCQWKISRACDEGQPIPEAMRQHAAECRSCAAHLRAAELTAAARPQPPAVPDGMHRRIMTGVAAARLSTSSSRVRAPRLAPAWASAAVLLVVAGMYFRGASPPVTPPQAHPAEPALPSVAIAASVIEDADSLMTAALEEEGWKIVEDLRATSRGLIAALDPLL